MNNFKLTKVQQVAVGFVLLLIGYLLGEFVLNNDKKASMESTQRKINEVREKIDNAKRIQARAAQLQEEMDHLRQQLDGLKKVLPVEVNHASLFKDIRRIANQEGIAVEKISNNKVVESDVIRIHPFTVNTKGNYHDYGRFFAALANYPKIVSAKGIHLHRIDDPTFVLSGKFILSFYTYREPTAEELKAQIEAKRQEQQGGAKGGR